MNATDLALKIRELDNRELENGENDENMANWLVSSTSIKSWMEEKGYDFVYEAVDDEDFVDFVKANYDDCLEAVQGLEEEEAEIR